MFLQIVTVHLKSNQETLVADLPPDNIPVFDINQDLAAAERYGFLTKRYFTAKNKQVPWKI